MNRRRHLSARGGVNEVEALRSRMDSPLCTAPLALASVSYQINSTLSVLVYISRRVGGRLGMIIRDVLITRLDYEGLKWFIVVLTRMKTV